MREALEVTRDLGHRHVGLRGGVGQLLGLLDQARLHRRHGAGVARARAAAHDRIERAGARVEHEQRLGHLRLHAEHVDQEAERAEVAGDAVEQAGLRHARRVDLGLGQALDFVAHAQQRSGGLLDAQHRQHAAHRAELVGHRDQHLAVVGLAEELVDRLLGLGQRGAQFLHHAAHGLAVGDAAVELLHPRLERLGAAPLTHRAEPVGQAAHALGLLRVVEVGILERRLDVQQAGGHLHRQLRVGRRAAVDGLGDRHLQLGRESLAEREQALERITDQRELLVQAGQAMQLATGHALPGFLGRGDALARLHQHGRVEAAQRAGVIVDRQLVRQRVDLAHRGQARRAPAVAGRVGLRAEEQQILREPLGDLVLAALEHAVLRQQARGDALAEDVEAEQAVGLRLEHRGSELPQRRHLQIGGGRAQPGAAFAHARGRQHRLRRAHDAQQVAFHRRARGGVERARRHAGVRRNLAPVPVDAPQVGRVDALGAGGFLHGAVLREHRQRRHRLAGQQAGEIVEQRERSVLDLLDDRRRELVRLGDELLHQRLAGAQHQRGLGQADQLERAGALVDGAARTAQHGRVDGVDVGAADRLGLLQAAAQRLVRRLEGAAQFVLHPGQGAQVIGGCAPRRGIRGGSRVHAVLGCQAGRVTRS